jgi:hypothetical protein
MNETSVQEDGRRKECCKVQKKERKNEIHQNLYARLENSRGSEVVKTAIKNHPSNH